jgi:ATP-binding cassette subfamily B protein
VASNIGYARAGAGRDEIVAAARAAQLHDTIAALPDGYDSPVGERGVNFSGGERQRIGIARAILKQPVILVFDEATSALDAVSEHAIVKELERLSERRTTLVIAHRLSTIVHAHAIIVMDQGRIVEQGTHEELLRRKGVYARLWLLQKKTPGEPGV